MSASSNFSQTRFAHISEFLPLGEFERKQIEQEIQNKAKDYLDRLIGENYHISHQILSLNTLTLPIYYVEIKLSYGMRDLLLSLNQSTTNIDFASEYSRQIPFGKYLAPDLVFRLILRLRFSNNSKS